MSINAQSNIQAFFILYALVMVVLIPRDTGTAELLFWGGLAATFVILHFYAQVAMATGDVGGLAALLGLVVGGVVVVLLRNRGFSPEAVALLPWGSALIGPAIQAVGALAIEAKRRFGNPATGLAALSRAEKKAQAGPYENADQKGDRE